MLRNQEASMSRIKARNGGWLLPSGVFVTPKTIRISLGRIPVEDRQAISQRKVGRLRRTAKEAVARLASRLYSTAFNQYQSKHGGKRIDLDWWHIGKGSYRPAFQRAWDGYEQGFTPGRMIECALWLAAKKRMWDTRFPRPSQVFGPFVLSTLLNGWNPDGASESRAQIPDGCEIPIPLDRAYTGPEASQRMAVAEGASWVWEPGLVFDPDVGMYVPKAKAGPNAMDLENVG